MSDGCVSAARTRSLPVTSSPGSTARTLLAVDDGSFYRLYSVNDDAAALALTLDLSAWGAAPGASVIAEEMSKVTCPLLSAIQRSTE